MDPADGIVTVGGAMTGGIGETDASTTGVVVGEADDFLGVGFACRGGLMGR